VVELDELKRSRILEAILDSLVGLDGLAELEAPEESISLVGRMRSRIRDARPDSLDGLTDPLGLDELISLDGRKRFRTRDTKLDNLDGLVGRILEGLRGLTGRREGQVIPPDPGLL